MPAQTAAVRGYLRVRVVEGKDLAKSDRLSKSDPYVKTSVGKNRAQTRVIKNCLNPKWNEELELATSDPPEPLKLVVYDRDYFTSDDEIGKAEIDLTSLVTAVQSKHSLNCEDGATIRKIPKSKQNCFANDSILKLENGHIVQVVCVQLQSVKRGEIKLELKWQPCT